MTPFFLETFSDPFYRFRTTLDGSTYVLDFAFNVREQCWYMGISDVNEVSLLEDTKLVCSSNLFIRKAYDPNMPPGVLAVMSRSQDDSPPGLFDLAEGGRCQLVYFAVNDQ